MVERIYHLSLEKLSHVSIEVIHPEVGEFLIGDSPVLVVDRSGRNGPLEGVNLETASQVLMPLGPATMIACGPTDATGVLPDHLVKGLNAMQVRAASKHVFIRPGSGLDAFVREVRFGV
jgi:hypothetical protein